MTHDMRKLESGQLMMLSGDNSVPGGVICYGMQVTHDVSHLSAADVFRAPGVQTPLIARFSTVIHERGSPETLRDPRGFAVRCLPPCES